MRGLILRFLPILFAILCCSGSEIPLAGGSDPIARDQDLIILDLSRSLTDGQRRSIPNLITGFVLKEARNADVTVYPLVADMGHSETLVPQLHPPTTGRLVDIVDWQNNVQHQWAPALKASVEGILKLPKKKQDQVYTSCYIASAVFANQYFSGLQNAGKLRLLWVGDLIEDCPLPQFHQYRLPNKDSVEKIGKLDPDLKRLSIVEVIGAIVPRDPLAAPSDVPFMTTIDYWRALAPRLGMTPKLVNIGPASAVLPPPKPIQ
jgi:hypothetical protein